VCANSYSERFDLLVLVVILITWALVAMSSVSLCVAAAYGDQSRGAKSSVSRLSL
jgi:hypothetical protein